MGAAQQLVRKSEAPKVLKAFARTHDVPKRYTDYRALLEKEALDAVSVATSRLLKP